MKYCIHREGAPKGARQGSGRKDEEEDEGLPKGKRGLEGPGPSITASAGDHSQHATTVSLLVKHVNHF